MDYESQDMNVEEKLKKSTIKRYVRRGERGENGREEGEGREGGGEREREREREREMKMKGERENCYYM